MIDHRHPDSGDHSRDVDNSRIGFKNKVYPTMSFQALKEVFKCPTLKISTLRKFPKEHLHNLCEAKCIKILNDGKRVLKEKYVQALFSAVSGYSFRYKR